MFFWPKDFTFVCPTEIAAFGKLNDEFADRDAQVLGASVDNEFVHFQWRAQHEDLKTLPFPMLSDLKRELAQATGVLNADGVADRATFIVDPNNEIQFVSVTAGSVGRNVDEVLRVLDALQSDELCACNWRKGDPTIAAGDLMSASVWSPMSIDNLKEALPEYAKDLKLNLGSLSRTTELNEQQLWGTFLASAVATGNSTVIAEISAEAADVLSGDAYNAALGAASIMGMNNVAYRAKASSAPTTSKSGWACG